jgi:hypothetical protein
MLKLLARIAFSAYSPHERTEILQGRSRKVFKCGVHAAYARIHKDWGAKVFVSAEQRDDNYVLQGALAAEGMAPKLGEKFESTTPRGNKVYGFITQHVTVLATMKEVTKDQESQTSKIRQDALVYGVGDLHNENMGVTSDGIIVVIDVSVSEDSERDGFYDLENMDKGG